MTTRFPATTVDPNTLNESNSVKYNTPNGEIIQIQCHPCRFVRKTDKTRCTNYVSTTEEYCLNHKRLIEKKKDNTSKGPLISDSPIEGTPRKRKYEQDHEYVSQSDSSTCKRKKEQEKPKQKEHDQDDDDHLPIGFKMDNVVDIIRSIDNFISVDDLEVDEKLELLKLGIELYKSERRLYTDSLVKIFQCATPDDRNYTHMVEKMGEFLTK